MNIEQEFKELHELLLCAYDEDYEESLDKALSKLDNLKKQLLLHNVSQQRELLIAYEIEINKPYVMSREMAEEKVGRIMKAINCG